MRLHRVDFGLIKTFIGTLIPQYLEGTRKQAKFKTMTLGEEALIVFQLMASWNHYRKITNIQKRLGS